MLRNLYRVSGAAKATSQVAKTTLTHSKRLRPLSNIGHLKPTQIMMLNQARWFSPLNSSTNSPYMNGLAMTSSDANTLNDAQNSFNNDP